MKKYSPALLSVLLISSLMMFAPLAQAYDGEDTATREQELDAREQELNKREQALNKRTQSYGDKVAEKAWSGFVNMNSAPLEIPKNIINVTNESNVAFGFIGGTTKGILNTVGRFMSGLADVVTAPIITQPIVQPERIWHDFDAETTYGPVFRLDNEPNGFEFVKETGDKEKAVVIEDSPNCAAAIERSANCEAANQEVKTKFNRMFKDEMMK
jgi:putative exosortase-associated protein (TIGR04073 family)